MDQRNSCRNFLSACCPNNCHYADWCKNYEEKDYPEEKDEEE